MPRRRSLSRCAVKPRIDEPSKVRLSQLLSEELLVVIEHVQAAFEVAEQHGHGLDALLVGQVLEALFLDLVQTRRGSCAAPSPSDSVLPVRRRKVPENCAVQWTWISFSLLRVAP